MHVPEKFLFSGLYFNGITPRARAFPALAARGFFAMKSMRSGHLIPISILLALLFWELLARFSGYPPFILPGPALVWQRFLQTLSDGSLLRHTLVTLEEVLLGLALGVITATSLGYALAKFDWLERLLSPYIVASQSVPVVAIAPLLVIWFGAGLVSKVLIAALIVFFPVLINTIVGLRSVPAGLRDLMRSLQATPWQTFRLLEVPAALPVFLAGLRVGATLAVIGAVVGEFVGANRGLGFLVNLGRGMYDTALVFVAVFALITLAMLLYGAVALLETHLLAWRE
ncbi:MAG TPA: ABC transporter permease [Chloroflexi bacterium]|nr:ABC transporter permease [Chloroflexota bacterium]HBY08313.1 ABC transporter permease [Chloroflexota bacterium]